MVEWHAIDASCSVCGTFEGIVLLPYTQCHLELLEKLLGNSMENLSHPKWQQMFCTILYHTTAKNNKCSNLRPYKCHSHYAFARCISLTIWTWEKKSGFRGIAQLFLCSENRMLQLNKPIRHYFVIQSKNGMNAKITEVGTGTCSPLGCFRCFFESRKQTYTLSHNGPQCVIFNTWYLAYHLRGVPRL